MWIVGWMLGSVNMGAHDGELLYRCARKMPFGATDGAA